MADYINMSSVRDVIAKTRRVLEQSKVGNKLDELCDSVCDLIAEGMEQILPADVRENEYCEFEKSGYLDELCCSHCFNTIGTIADTQRMRFCPYCGRTRIRR